MEKHQRTAITDVVFSKSAGLDFGKCCKLFSRNESIVVNGNLVQTSIWRLPSLVKYFVKDEANQAIVKLAFETLCNYEKKFAGAGLSFMKIVALEKDYSLSKSIRSGSSFIMHSVQKSIECEYAKKILQQIQTADLISLMT